MTRATKILDALQTEGELTAPQVREAIGLASDTYGTQQAHAALRRMEGADLVKKVELGPKKQKQLRLGTTGRNPKVAFKITPAGRKALKAAA